MNRQRTGRPGWQAIWYGLFRLAERVETHRLTVEPGERSDQWTVLCRGISLSIRPHFVYAASRQRTAGISWRPTERI